MVETLHKKPDSVCKRDRPTLGELARRRGVRPETYAFLHYVRIGA